MSQQPQQGSKVGQRLEQGIGKLGEADVKLPSCCNMRCMTIIANTFSLIMGPCLIFVGVFNFLFDLFGDSITGQTSKVDPYAFACVIFSVYTVMFGALIIISVFRLRSCMGRTFAFLNNPIPRAMFIILSAFTLVVVPLFCISTGTLCMGSGVSSRAECQWTGYIIGGLVVATGIFHLGLACNERPKQGVPIEKKPPPMPQPARPYQPGQTAPLPDQFVGTDNAMRAAVATPQGAALVSTAGTAVVGSMLAGQSHDQALAAAAANPEVQRAAWAATTAAAANPEVRRAAASAASQGIQNLLGAGYDRLFGEDASKPSL